jgi:hypothetical protein
LIAFNNLPGLYVNLNKTKIVVFRSRGNVKPEERWSLNCNPVEICDDFVYLGLLFHYNGSFLLNMFTFM